MGRKQKFGKKYSRNSKSSGDEDGDLPKPRRSKRNKGRNYQPIDDSNAAQDYQLRQRLQATGKLAIVDMESDGNCLFRAISDQLYYDYGNSHAEIRLDVCDYLEAFEDFFRNFLVLDDEDCPIDDEDAKDFEQYVYNMRQDSEWGGNLELVAAARLYQRNITLYQFGAALTFEPGDNQKPNGPPLLLSYHENEHYNSVRDATISRPPPAPTKSFSAESFKLDTSSTENEEELYTNGSDISVTEEEEPPSSAKRITKNAPCPCGSGLKYKKCCWAKEKRKQNVQKVRGLSDVDDAGSTASEEEDNNGSEDDFKVLKI